MSDGDYSDIGVMEHPDGTDETLLPAASILTGSVEPGLRPGEAFAPTDPGDEARAHLTPSGLAEALAEDVEGLEEQSPFGVPEAIHPVTAIDAGVVKLGDTSDGVVGAVRAAAVTRMPDGSTRLRTYRPGIFCFNSTNRLDIFHGMGRALGRASFYVQLDDDDLPVEEKVRLGPNDHRLLDRARNFVERLVQRDVCQQVQGHLILLDGALTLRTFDTPSIFLEDLHETCQDRGNSLIAVAKKTGLSVRGVDIRLLLDRPGGLPGRRRLTTAVRGDRDGNDRRVLGDLYVARFSPGGDTYRTDVDPAPGFLSREALDQLAAGSLFRNGYPEPLLQAHAFSYLAPPLVAELQAYAIARYGLVVRPEPNLGPVFAPFGGRWK